MVTIWECPLFKKTINGEFSLVNKRKLPNVDAYESQNSKLQLHLWLELLPIQGHYLTCVSEASHTPKVAVGFELVRDVLVSPRGWGSGVGHLGQFNGFPHWLPCGASQPHRHPYNMPIRCSLSCGGSVECGPVVVVGL